MVAEGRSEDNRSIEAAASAKGLDFIPLAQELYQLVIPEAVFETAVCQELLTLLQKESFKKAISNFGGYDTAKTGTILWVG